jgi:hypothetical protein
MHAAVSRRGPIAVPRYPIVLLTSYGHERLTGPPHERAVRARQLPSNDRPTLEVHP